MLLVLGAALPARAEKPLWEAGLGAGVLSFPDYRGSDQQRTYLLPIPYFVYHGERLKVDRRGIRGLIYESTRVDLDVSLDGAVPVDSHQNGVRAGMADLDPVFEIGPSLDLTLAEGEWGEALLRLPARATFATDLRTTRHLGWLFNPHLGLSGGREWQWGISLGPLYATEGYHDYYYEVEAADATAGRPAYDATGGFSGTRLTFSLTRRFQELWFGAFLRYDDVSHAVFADSPLVREERAVMAGVSLAWVVARSERSVPDEASEPAVEVARE
jgi:outer membrane scaffolding protein for murein synthesis (MipA/OmpV family)